MFDAVLNGVFNGTMSVMDFLLGWMFFLPTWLQVVIVAISTSAILTFTRPLTTNQDLLLRCKKDKKRLGELIRQAKKTKDKEAILRYRKSIAGIGMKTMKAEFKPLLLAIIPLAALGTWCFERLGYVPPQVGNVQEVRMYVSPSVIGRTAHLVPQKGIDVAGNAWIQKVVEDPSKEPSGEGFGVAVWKIKAVRSDTPYNLDLRCGDETVTKQLIVDGKRYAPAVMAGCDVPIKRIELVMEPYKPFGIIPGVPYVLPQPWIVAYLLLTIPFVFTLRWLCKIN